MNRVFQLALAVLMAALSVCEPAFAEGTAPQTHGGGARVKVIRTKELGFGLRDARVKLDGRQVASLGRGETAVFDLAPGRHVFAVDVWDHPNVYKMTLFARPGKFYTLEVSAREEAVASSFFGGAGMLAEAGANKNGGLFKIRIASEK